MTAFDQAFEVVIGHEGGLTNNPADPGGLTKFGISQRAYPSLDIADLTIDGAKAIYRRDYWAKIRGDDLPPSLALLCFDAAANNGVERAIRWLQMAAGVTADGVIGPQTLAAVTRRGAQAMCVEFMAQRVAFMGSLPTWRTFGLGWARRLCALPWQAMQMEAA